MKLKYLQELYRTNCSHSKNVQFHLLSERLQAQAETDMEYQHEILQIQWPQRALQRKFQNQGFVQSQWLY